MEKQVKQIFKATSPKDNLEFKLEKVNVQVKIGNITLQPEYILSIGDKNKEIAPYYKLFLDEEKNPCEIVLKQVGKKHSIANPDEVKERYGKFIDKVHQVYYGAEAYAYSINPAMEEEECLN